MSKVVFNVAELEVIAIYECNTRLETIGYMREVMRIIEINDEDDMELMKLMVSGAYKLAHITDAEFKQLDLWSYLHDQGVVPDED